MSQVLCYLGSSKDSGYSVVQDISALEALHGIICRSHACGFGVKQPAQDGGPRDPALAHEMIYNDAGMLD